MRFIAALTFLPSYLLAFSFSSTQSTSSKALRQFSSSTNVDDPVLLTDKNYNEYWAIVDGSEWRSMERHLREQGLGDAQSFAAALCFATGVTKEGDRVVGLRNTAARQLYPASVARIPPKVSNQHAAQTMQFAWAAVHCLLPTIADIGGSSQTSMISSEPVTVAIVGSNDYAQAAARALAALDCQVNVITTKSLKFSERNIRVMPPSENKMGFAEKLGKFDALLDTLGDESPLTTSFAEETVLDLLKSQHNCYRYVSTVTRQQQLFSEAGLISGSGRAKDHADKLGGAQLPQPPAPRQLGTTIQSLLEAGITWPVNKMPTSTVRQEGFAATVRGWTMGDYWESSTWPRDIDSNARFGFPVTALSLWMEESQDEEEEGEIVMRGTTPLFNMLRDQKKTPIRDKTPRTKKPQSEALAAAIERQEQNPHNILQFQGVRGLKDYIVDAELNGCVFLSAPFCRTCRYLRPQYQRLSRMQKGKRDVVFCQADATGEIGKELGRYLGVEAVPSFILFRKGEVYGFPLSVTRFPSPLLDRALQLLESGKDWDSETIRGSAEDDESEQ